VVIHGSDDRSDSLPVVPHGLSGGSCANYTVLSNANDDTRLPRREALARQDIANDILLAVRRLAPDAHCEG
jgi:hypothetical protein